MKKQLLSFILLLLLITLAKAQKPVANFSVSPDSVCASYPDNFTDLSLNHPTRWKWSFPGAIPDTSSDQNPQNIFYLNGGVFNIKLVVSNSNGSDSLSKPITVYPELPTPYLTQNNDTLFCNDDTSYTYYEWFYDTTLVSYGVKDTFYVVGQNGNYNVMVTNENCCTVSVGLLVGPPLSDIDYVSHNLNLNIPCGTATSINIYSYANIISIFPNPATNQLTIQTSLHANEAATVSIMNVLGQEVFQSSICNFQSSINISSFPAGLYFVRVSNDKESWIGKFVKE